MPLYPGSGKATFLNANSQADIFVSERLGPGSPNVASKAFLLERQKAASYPFGFAIQITFSADPGVFAIDVQGAETDVDGSYFPIGTRLSQVNASFVTRFDGVGVYPKFVRAFVLTLTNDVLISGVITR